MRNFAKKFEKYIFEILGVRVEPLKFPEEKQLPLFLRERYEFYQCRVLNLPCLLMVARGEDEVSPALIRTHVNLVREKYQQEVIYLSPAMRSYHRKRLVEQKVSFAVPGKQLYLPLLALDFREHIQRLRLTGKRRFSPATQVVVLYALYREMKGDLTPKMLAEKLNYSPMTMTRAFDELERSGLGNVAMRGRERVLRFDMDKADLWDQALAHLCSPVQKRIILEKISGNMNFLIAGLSGLSHYTILAEPKTRVFAVAAKEWRLWKQEGKFVEQAAPELGSIVLEIWNYAPKLFADNEVVDPLSLFLSLRDSRDERVESALSGLLEGIEW